MGCGALHVLWADLGEVRTVAAHPRMQGRGVGHAVVARLLDVARELRLQRIFVLTFETEFFGSHGFQEIEGTPVTAEVYGPPARLAEVRQAAEARGLAVRPAGPAIAIVGAERATEGVIPEDAIRRAASLEDVFVLLTGEDAE